VEVVADLPGEPHHAGFTRFLHRYIEVDHRIILPCVRADPAVDRLPPLLALRIGIGRSLIGQQCPDDHLQPRGLGACQQLAVRGDELRGTCLLMGTRRVADPSDVVDPFEEHDMRHAGHAQHIAFEPRQRVGSAPVVQQPVAADPGIGDRPATAAGRCGEQSLKLVGPAHRLALGRAGAFGDRIAERDQHAGLATAGHLDARHDARRPSALGIRQHHRPGLVARRDIDHLRMRRGLGLAGIMDGDGEPLARRDRKRDRVAEIGGTGRDDDVSRSRKAQRPPAPRHRRARGIEPHDRCAAEPQRRIAKLVRQPDAQRTARDPGAYHLPHRLVTIGPAKAIADPGLIAYRRRGPRRDPAFGRGRCGQQQRGGGYEQPLHLSWNSATPCAFI